MNVEFISSNYCQTAFIRGHVDFEEAAEAVRKACIKQFGEDKEYQPPQHTYFRARPDNTGEYTGWYYEAHGPGRGAFPVTVFGRWW